MSKSIEELPKYRKEEGRSTAYKKEEEIIREPSVEISPEYQKELMSMFKKPVEKPSGIARLFGAAQGAARKIGDYFVEAKRWTEFQFAKRELAKKKSKENIFQSIEQNEEKIDLTAFRKVLEGTSEAVDLDVSEFEERSENGLANLEEKAEEAEVGNEIPELTRKFMEALEREAEEAKEEFKEEMSDEEYEERTREAKELLGEEYKIPSPKELEEEISEKKKEKFAKLGYEIPSPGELKKKQKEKEVKMDSFSAEEQLRIIKDQLENLKEKGIKWKEIIELEERQKKLEQELREFEREFGKAFKKEEKEEIMSDKEYEEREREAKELMKEEEKESEKEKEMPFGKKVIDESHKRYLEIKEYEEERGEAPKGDSAEFYLSFSFEDYKRALEKDPKKALKMEEEMYEKLTTYDKTRKRERVTRTGRII